MTNDPTHPSESNEIEASDTPSASTDPKDRFEEAVREKQVAPGDDDQEEPLWTGSYSHLAMIGSWVGGGLATLLALIGGLLASLAPGSWGILLGLVVLMWVGLACWYAYRRLSVHYELTTQRLIHEAGLLWRTVDRVELIDVDDVTYRQGPVERLFSVGTIIVTGSDRTTPELHLPGIENAGDVADLIDDARRKERRSRGLHIEAV